MATKSVLHMSTGIDGVSVNLYYDDKNLKLGEVAWENITGWEIQMFVWRYESLVYDRTEGPGSGSEQVPGSIRLVEDTDPDFGDYVRLPENIEVMFCVRSVEL